MLQGANPSDAEFTMILGNFPRDTPADEALRAASRLLAALPSGPRPVPPSSPLAGGLQPAASMTSTTTSAEVLTTETFPPASCRIYCPYVLTTCICVVFATPSSGRMVIPEAKKRCKKEVDFVGAAIGLYAGPPKRREESMRNRKLRTAASMIQTALRNDDADWRKEA